MQTRYTTVLIFGLALLCHSTAYSAVKLLITHNGIDETVWSDGNSVYIKNEQEPAYLLINPKQRTLYSVNTIDKQVIDLSEKVKNKPELPFLKDIILEYVHHGNGPTIIGFETEMYLLKVNGDVCLTEFISKNVSQLSNVLEGFEILSEQQISTKFASLPANLDLCFVADYMTYQRHAKHGFPLKTVDRFGENKFELRSVKIDDSQPADNFTIPNQYTLISYDEMMSLSNTIVPDPSNELHVFE